MFVSCKDCKHYQQPTCKRIKYNNKYKSIDKFRLKRQTFSDDLVPAICSEIELRDYMRNSPTYSQFEYSVYRSARNDFEGVCILVERNKVKDNHQYLMKLDDFAENRIYRPDGKLNVYKKRSWYKKKNSFGSYLYGYKDELIDGVEV